MALHTEDDLFQFFFGERVYVESSNISWLKYDYDAKWLYVGMKHGGIYLYPFTTYEESEDFVRADSQGKWIWEHCIRARRPFERVVVPAEWASGNEPRIQPTLGTDNPHGPE